MTIKQKTRRQRVIFGLFVYLALCSVCLRGYSSLYSSITSLIHGPLVSPLEFGHARALDYGLVCAVSVLWIAIQEALRRLRMACRPVPAAGRFKRLRDLADGVFGGGCIGVWAPMGMVVSLGAAWLGVLAFGAGWLAGARSPLWGWFWLAMLLAVCQIALALMVWGLRVLLHERAPLSVPAFAASALSVLKLAYLLLAQGIIISWFCTAMVQSFSTCLPMRPPKWTWPRYASLAGGIVLAGLSFLRSPLQADRIVSWLRSGLRAWPDGAQDLAWAAIAVCSLLTCMSHCLDLAPPVFRLASLARIPAKDNRGTREAHMFWLAGTLTSAAAAGYGLARWPTDNAWCLLIAMTLGFSMRETDPSSLLAAVFYLIPRWTVWMVVARQAGWGWAGVFLLCEALLLLPTLHGSWVAWQCRADLPGALRKRPRRWIVPVRMGKAVG